MVFIHIILSLIIDTTFDESTLTSLTPTTIETTTVDDSKKEKLTTILKDIEQYVKSVSLSESEANELKTKEDELAKEKKEIHKKIQTLIKEQETKKEEFSKIKQERKSKFCKFFNQLQSILTTTYKTITSSENSPGGNAFIYNTNEDEPYNGNICYLPTPPGKRVIYDIDQLSGGEKTLAILSLLVSLQKISNTPFLILEFRK